MSKKVSEQFKTIKDIYLLQCICTEQDEEIERLNKALQDIKEYIETRAGTEIHDMMYVMETDEILDIVNKAIGE